eukprot:CAMPEP_0114157266 /NCGR_PEP_ID=MMETSP0043_2-20121206/26522_1 /TAXON_ID=464988 /ORGANISM="Hemiselmis andersenii, Strain CCMP644" /LENGTH=51 /DNA_ID=CAMNT_0001252807 /DNA_START=56 /DNA_END=208 /DNA_ORIENTATION=+
MAGHLLRGLTLVALLASSLSLPLPREGTQNVSPRCAKLRNPPHLSSLLKLR